MVRKEDIAELYRRCATELPEDVFLKLRDAYGKEDDGTARHVLGTVVENAGMAKKESKPICQDTGTPVFYVGHDGSVSERDIREMIEEATLEATESVPLRPNACDPLTGKNAGNMPMIHFEVSDRLRIDLLLKGGGSENISAMYCLPSCELNAERDVEGVKRCVMDAVFRAQGKGCPPYVVGVAFGGGAEEVMHLSKRQLLRRLDDVNEEAALRELEDELLEGINRLGIGPLGLGGKTTCLAVKAAKCFRHPASFFVGVSFSCWALRRQSYV